MCRRRVSLFAYCIDRLFDFRIASLQRSNPCISFLSATSSFMGSEMAAVYQDKFFFFFSHNKENSNFVLFASYIILLLSSVCSLFSYQHPFPFCVTSRSLLLGRVSKRKSRYFRDSSSFNYLPGHVLIWNVYAVDTLKINQQMKSGQFLHIM